MSTASNKISVGTSSSEFKNTINHLFVCFSDDSSLTLFLHGNCYRS